MIDSCWKHIGEIEKMNNERMTLLKKDGLEVPLRRHPIRFAVRGKGGFTSNLWGVQVKRKGDAYIYCRDDWKEQKISLHASGKQHISFNENASDMKFYTGGPLHESVVGTAIYSKSDSDLSSTISSMGHESEDPRE